MLELLIGFAVGVVVGWQFPQPSWAVDLQEKIKGMFKK